MRTLKKVLAMTVVLATLLSISAFAGFSDEDTIDDNFVEAVNLLGALNVMTGDKEGTFRPNDTIMRAEAAKMIYVIRNGGVDDLAAGWTGMTTFSDVPAGAWYEGYVNYCASLGIIAGVGNGKFNPNGAVTGVELAKMLLVVADYKPEIEGYTGTGWNLNVIRDAQTAGMFKGYTLAYSAAATRQQAAQLFSNAILETQMAVYIGDTRVNDLAMITNTGTIGGRYFGLFTVTGILTEVQHVDLPVDLQDNNNALVLNQTNVGDTSNLNSNDELSEVFVTDRDDRGNMIGATTFEFAADPDLLYQEVDVIFREDTDDPGVLSRDAKVYAVLSTGNTYVYETTMDAITIDLKDNSKNVSYAQGADYNPLTIQFEGYNGGRAKTLERNFTLPIVTNLYESATFDAATAVGNVAQAAWNNSVWVVNENDISMLATTSTAPVRLIDFDRDGELDIAFITTPYYGTVSSYNADRYEFATSATIDGDSITTGRRQADFENFTFEDDLTKDDVIAIDIDVTSGEILYNVSLVEPTTGNVTYVYATDPDNEVVIGGETYGFYGLLFDGQPVDVSANDYTAAYEDEVTVYTDGKYIISGQVDPATLGDGFAFVKNYNLSGNSFDSMLVDSKAILVELVLPSGETVVKEYRRDEAVSSSNAPDYYEDLYDANGDPRSDAGIGLLLDDMLGNIVEYKSSGNYVAFRNNHNKTDVTNDQAYDPDLAPRYHNAATNEYEYDSTTGLFRVENTTLAVDVGEDSVFFFPTYKAGKTKNTLVQGDITKVSVIKGSDLRGTPTITTANENGEIIMQLVSCLQNGVRTVAFGALDADSTVHETGLFMYTLTNDYDKDDGEEDARQVKGVLSNSGSDETATYNLDSDEIQAFRLYRASVDSDNVYTLSEIMPGRAHDGNIMDLGHISGVHGNNVTINDNVYSVTADTVIFVVDTSAHKGASRINLGSLSDLKEAKEINNVLCDNVLYEYDGDHKLTVVYVEAVGESLAALIDYDETFSGFAMNLPVLEDGFSKSEAEKAIENALPDTVVLEKIEWTAGNLDDNGNDAQAGSTYTAKVTMSVRSNLDVELPLAVTVGGNLVAVTENNDGTYSFSFSMTVAMNQITTADVNGLAVPGIKPSTTDPTGAKAAITGTVNNATFVEANGTTPATTGQEITWTEVSDPDNNDQPDAGDTYNASFNLKADAYYQFSSDFTEAYFESLFGSSDVMLTVNADRTLMNVNVLVVVGDETVNTVALTVAEVKTGDTLNATGAPTLTNAAVTVGNRAWKNGATNLNGQTAPAGATLTVTFTLTPAAGYVFGDTLNVTFTPDTGWAFVSAVKNVDRKTFTVTATVNVATAEATLGTITAFDADATVTDGVQVSAAQVALSGESGVKATTVWKDSDGKEMASTATFESSKTYTLTVTISLEAGYEWAANTGDDPATELNTTTCFTNFDDAVNAVFENNQFVVTGTVTVD